MALAPLRLTQDWGKFAWSRRRIPGIQKASAKSRRIVSDEMRPQLRGAEGGNGIPGGHALPSLLLYLNYVLRSTLPKATDQDATPRAATSPTLKSKCIIAYAAHTPIASQCTTGSRRVIVAVRAWLHKAGQMPTSCGEHGRCVRSRNPRLRSGL
jgi:hypothetical protein